MQGKQHTPERKGPRPLLQHLSAIAGFYVSSQTAWALLKDGLNESNSFLLHRDLHAPLETLLAEMTDHRTSESRAPKPRPANAATADPSGNPFAETVSRHIGLELAGRMNAFLDGINRYRTHPYVRTMSDLTECWREGTTFLSAPTKALEKKKGGPPLLLVPSLINRAYVMDLFPDTGFLGWLKENGTVPYLLDWDAPGPEEMAFGLGDYIGRIGKAASLIEEKHGEPAHIIGYCMGGTLSLAAVANRIAPACGLTLLATPWAFHGDGGSQARFVSAVAEGVLPFVSDRRGMSPDQVQMFFNLLDPLLAFKKFAMLSRLERGSREEQAFIALEDWLNDGIPLVRNVASECLLDWYGKDTPGKGSWKVGGLAVSPSAIDCPTHVVVPMKDRIVPPSSALPLAGAIDDASVTKVEIGHIGMMAGRRAVRDVWEPVRDFIIKSRA